MFFPSKQGCSGQILVLNVEDKKLNLVSKTSNKFGGGPVYCLIAFKGMLLAGRGEKIEILRWMLLDDGKRELRKVCEHRAPKSGLWVQSYGDFIISGSRMFLFIYQVHTSTIKSSWITGHGSNEFFWLPFNSFGVL